MPNLPGTEPQDAETSSASTLIEKVYEDFEPAQIPIAPDGGIAPGFAMDMGEEPYDPKAFICKQGPCRFFWQVGVAVDAVDGTRLDLRQLALSCIANPGTEMPLTHDQPVLECNRWDPMTGSELAEREHRRGLYQVRAAAAEALTESADDIVDDADQVEKGQP